MDRESGFSLIELMVSMVIGLIILGALVVMFGDANKSFRELNIVSRQLENGRYAVQTLGDDLAHAGFFGEFTGTASPTALHDPCSTDLAVLTDAISEMPIQGYDGAGVAPVGCLNNYLPNTDVIVVRRASTQTAALGALDNTTRYIQARVNDSEVNTGELGTFDILKRDGVTPADIRPLVQHIYYLRSCNDCADGDGIPTLVRVEMVGDVMVSTPLAEGIENLQVRYGIDDTGNGDPDRYETAGAIVLDDWANVVTAEASILVRAVEPSAGYADARSYQVGDVNLGVLGGPFKRQVLSVTTRIENLGGRREG